MTGKVNSAFKVYWKMWKGLIAPPEKRRNNQEIDGIRAVLFILVIIIHLKMLIGYPISFPERAEKINRVTNSSIPMLGGHPALAHWTVDVFFFISGIFGSRSYWLDDSELTVRSVLLRMFKRLTRLLPGVIFALTDSYFSDYFFHTIPEASSMGSGPIMAFFLSCFFNWNHMMSAHLWTCSAEVFFVPGVMLFVSIVKKLKILGYRVRRMFLPILSILVVTLLVIFSSVMYSLGILDKFPIEQTMHKLFAFQSQYSWPAVRIFIHLLGIWCGIYVFERNSEIKRLESTSISCETSATPTADVNKPKTKRKQILPRIIVDIIIYLCVRALFMMYTHCGDHLNLSYSPLTRLYFILKTRAIGSLPICVIVFLFYSGQKGLITSFILSIPGLPFLGRLSFNVYIVHLSVLRLLGRFVGSGEWIFVRIDSLIGFIARIFSQCWNFVVPLNMQPTIALYASKLWSVILKILRLPHVSSLVDMEAFHDALIVYLTVVLCCVGFALLEFAVEAILHLFCGSLYKSMEKKVLNPEAERKKGKMSARTLLLIIVSINVLLSCFMVYYSHGRDVRLANK
eukprot:gnl/Carplike_NY0171/1998_a2695_314.p1 GENE.gnl/Carplike_NY0171/1998_a2695_314~~gnl/Carplike_NY0171/1998_a2695_314.p1  ORF type:complete len:569 (-),score=73.13 gnl/Carplike_NY0171/1998_a2695_314:497-2203(-)